MKLANDKMPEDMLRKLFNLADKSGDGFIQEEEFADFSKMLGGK